MPEIERCDLPPEGWWCSRGRGHDGPCAARPVADEVEHVEALWRSAEAQARESDEAVVRLAAEVERLREDKRRAAELLHDFALSRGSTDGLAAVFEALNA